jgi:hypothetical protein
MNVWNLVDDSTPYIVILITYLLVSATDEDCDYQVQDDMCFAFYSFYFVQRRKPVTCLKIHRLPNIQYTA